MPTPVITDIADAIVTTLNGATFTAPYASITAVRLYQPEYDLEEMDSLKVSVVGRSQLVRVEGRGSNIWLPAVDIGIQKRPTTLSRTLLDELMQLVQDIADHLLGLPQRRLPAYQAAQCVEIRNEPIYAADHLAEKGMFTSVLTSVWRVSR